MILIFISFWIVVSFMQFSYFTQLNTDIIFEDLFVDNYVLHYMFLFILSIIPLTSLINFLLCPLFNTIKMNEMKKSIYDAKIELKYEYLSKRKNSVEHRYNKLAKEA